jgi:methylmalonyl-CoA mutase N-terminal domain/subunit
MDHGYDVAEGSSTPVMEIAFSLANCVAVIEECVKAGMDANKVASMISAHPHST